MKHRAVLLSIANLAVAPWPDTETPEFPAQIYPEDWKTQCTEAGGSSYPLPEPPKANGRYQTQKAKCGWSCRAVSGTCTPNCGDLWCTGFSFDDWSIESANHCGGTYCPDRPLPVPAPCDCTGPHKCSAWGDPHMQSFDGWKWDFGGDEEYETFGLAGKLHVTNENWKCNGGDATCMKRVNLWSEEWDGTMGEPSDLGGSVEIDKEGRLYIGCKEVNPRDLDGALPYTVPGTKGQLKITSMTRPDGEWVNSNWEFEYIDSTAGKVNVRVEAPIGKWTTSAFISFEGCKCDVKGLCNGPFEIMDCLPKAGQTSGLDVPAGCGALPPTGDPTRKSGLCKSYGTQTPINPPEPFPPRDCRSASVRKQFDYCCGKFNSGTCGTVPTDSTNQDVPRTSFYEQCLWENCQLNSDETGSFCMGQVDGAAAQDTSGDCTPQQPSPVAPPEEYTKTPAPAAPVCEGSWSSCDTGCTRTWTWSTGSGPGCTTPTNMPECIQGDGDCPTPPPPVDPNAGKCSNGAKDDGEEGVDCGGSCEKQCVECTPIKAKVDWVDGTSCVDPEERCAEMTFAAPIPPTGVGCQAPCAPDAEFCNHGKVFLQRPGTMCNDGTAKIAENINVYARGSGVNELGGVGQLKSDVTKVPVDWDMGEDGPPIVCYVPPSGASHTIQETVCTGTECDASWRRDPTQVRDPTTTTEPFTPDKTEVEKKDPNCNEGASTSADCEVVVTVQDSTIEKTAQTTCVPDVTCGIVDLAKAGTQCDSTDESNYIARDIPVKGVAGRSDLQQADVPASKMKQEWTSADQVCHRPRMGATAKAVTKCVDCSDLEVPSPSGPTPDGPTPNGPTPDTPTGPTPDTPTGPAPDGPTPDTPNGPTPDGSTPNGPTPDTPTGTQPNGPQPGSPQQPNGAAPPEEKKTNTAGIVAGVVAGIIALLGIIGFFAFKFMGAGAKGAAAFNKMPTTTPGTGPDSPTPYQVNVDDMELGAAGNGGGISI